MFFFLVVTKNLIYSLSPKKSYLQLVCWFILEKIIFYWNSSFSITYTCFRTIIILIYSQILSWMDPTQIMLLLWNYLLKNLAIYFRKTLDSQRWSSVYPKLESPSSPVSLSRLFSSFLFFPFFLKTAEELLYVADVCYKITFTTYPILLWTKIININNL